MSNGDTHVRPGEVISSSLINQILDRLAALEAGQPSPGSPPTGGGPVVIDHFEPLGEVEVGRLLAIVGTGFPFPANDTTVTLGGFSVPAGAYLQTSTSNRLEFAVPDLGSVPPEGRDLFVRVRNGAASAQRLYRFLPRIDATPAPTISAVHPPGQAPPTPVQMGAQVVVDGANFEANPNDNIITLRPLLTGAQTYPLVSAPLVIDVPGSGTTRIAFTVPDMAEITGGMGARRVRLEVRVTTNPTPATAEFFAFR
jgi:hypothetical protein